MLVEAAGIDFRPLMDVLKRFWTIRWKAIPPSIPPTQGCPSFKRQGDQNSPLFKGLLPLTGPVTTGLARFRGRKLAMYFPSGSHVILKSTPEFESRLLRPKLETRIDAEVVFVANN
jgi:hypothetical protein